MLVSQSTYFVPLLMSLGYMVRELNKNDFCEGCNNIYHNNYETNPPKMVVFSF